MGCAANNALDGRQSLVASDLKCSRKLKLTLGVGAAHHIHDLATLAEKLNYVVLGGPANNQVVAANNMAGNKADNRANASHRQGLRKQQRRPEAAPNTRNEPHAMTISSAARSTRLPAGSVHPLGRVFDATHLNGTLRTKAVFRLSLTMSLRPVVNQTKCAPQMNHASVSMRTCICLRPVLCDACQRRRGSP